MYAESSAGKSTIPAQAELIEPMGAETLIHARTKLGGDIRVVVPRTQRIKIGEVLHLKPDPKQTHFFGIVLHAGDYCAPFSLKPFIELNMPMVGVFGRNDGDGEREAIDGGIINCN